MSQPFPAQPFFSGNLCTGIVRGRRARSAGARRAAERSRRNALSQRPQSAIRAARSQSSLVHRRRHDPRLSHRRRPRRLSQSLGAHAEMGGRTRRASGAVRQLGQSRDHRSLGPGQGCRRRQHQHRLARRQVVRARGRPSAVRARSRNARRARLLGFRRRVSTARALPRIPRSIRKPAKWSSLLTPPPAASRRRWPMA